MKAEDKYTGYTDFLKDREFIQWQLVPDEKLNRYWEEFFTAHPELQDMSQKAILYLKKKGINKSSLSEIEHVELLERIQKAIRQEKNINRHKNLRYTVASAAAITLIIIGISLFSRFQHENQSGTSDKELIVGELLNNEDIQLITTGEAILFRNDVEVTLSEEGTAEIIQESNHEISKVQIARDKLNSLIVPYGKRSTLTLADGSKIWLNSGSVLKFPAQFSGNKREIRLTSGEMYIEVTPEKEKPFYVHTGDINVKVYGTKFNISNYAGSPQSVVLVEGSVSVQSKDYQELFIKPGEKAVYSEAGLFNTEVINTEQFISWKDGYLTFDKTLITEVLQQISRYYNLSFNFENDVNLRHRTCTGKIYLSDNLDNVMTTVALLTSTSYDKQYNKIYITNQSN